MNKINNINRRTITSAFTNTKAWSVAIVAMTANCFIATETIKHLHHLICWLKM